MKSLAMMVCAVMMTMSVGAATASAASPVAPSPQMVNVDPSVVAEKSKQASPTTGATDTERYGAREQNAKGLEDFQGGSSGIYIGGSAVTLLLVVLLIVIIL